MLYNIMMVAKKQHQAVNHEDEKQQIQPLKINGLSLHRHHLHSVIQPHQHSGEHYHLRKRTATSRYHGALHRVERQKRYIYVTRIL